MCNEQSTSLRSTIETIGDGESIIIRKKNISVNAVQKQVATLKARGHIDQTMRTRVVTVLDEDNTWHKAVEIFKGDFDD